MVNYHYNYKEHFMTNDGSEILFTTFFDGDVWKTVTEEITSDGKVIPLDVDWCFEWDDVYPMQDAAGDLWQGKMIEAGRLDE